MKRAGWKAGWLAAVALAAACGGGSKATRPTDTADAPEEGGVIGGVAGEPAEPAEPPPSRDPIDLPAAAPAVGDVVEIVETVESDGMMLAAGREVKLGRRAELKRREEVVAVDGVRVIKLKVSFEAGADKRTVGAQEQEVASPIAGKTFVVGLDKKGRHTLTEDGKAVKGKLKDYVLDELRDDVGAPTRLGAVLGGKTYKAGEVVAVPAKDLITVLPEGRDDLKGETIDVAFVERRGDIATFSLAGTLSRPEGKMTLTLTFKGTLDVDVKTGRAVRSQLDAETKGTGGAELTGTLKSTKTLVAP